METNLQGSSHRLKAVGGAYDKRKDLFMNTAIIICLVMAAVFYIAAYFQFKEKGILLNNAYLYASAEERNSMDKKPYYRQSGIVFSFIGTIFVLNILQVVTGSGLVVYFIIAMSVITLIYAIASSVIIWIKLSK